MAEGVVCCSGLMAWEWDSALVLLVERTTQGLWNRAWRSICDCCSLGSMRQSWPLKSCRSGSWLVRNEFKRNPLCPSAQGPCNALAAQPALCWWSLDCAAWMGFTCGNLGTVGRSVGMLAPEESGPCHGDVMKGRKDGIAALPPHLLRPGAHSFSFALIITTYVWKLLSLIGEIVKYCNYIPGDTFYKTLVQCCCKPLDIQVHTARNTFYSMICCPSCRNTGFERNSP